MAFKQGGDFEGCVPYMYAFNTKQLSEYMEDGYAYIGDGKVITHIVQNGYSDTFDMGDEPTIKEVVEFTFSDNGKKLLCRNIDGVVVEYALNRLTGTSLGYSGIVATNAIKIAGGQILKQDGSKYAVANGKLVPIGENNVIDIIPNGNSILEIKADVESANIISVSGSYKVTKDNKLINGDIFISNGVKSIKYAEQSFSPGRTWIGDRETNALCQISASSILSGQVFDEWIDAHNNFINSLEFDCIDYGWIGWTSRPRYITNGYCLSTTQTASSVRRRVNLAIMTDGTIKEIQGNSLVDVILTDRGAQGWLNSHFNKGKYTSILYKISGALPQDFPDQEFMLYGTMASKLSFVKTA